jgi:hypothetical protein
MKTLTRWADVTVAVCVVLKFILAEVTGLDRGTALRTRHIGHDPSLLAGLNILDLEIALVGNGFDGLDAKDLLRRLSSLRQYPRLAIPPSKLGGTFGQPRPMSTTWLVTCCSTISLCLVSTAT